MVKPWSYSRNTIQDFAGGKDLLEIYHDWPQANHGRFHREDPTFEIRRQFRRARGNRATGEIA